MPKGKKQILLLVILCVLLAAGICLYIFLPKGEAADSEGEESTAETVRVADIDPDQITGVSNRSEGEEDILLKKEEGTWKLEKLPGAPVDQDVVKGLFDCVSPVTATKELEVSASGLSEYGLDKPQLTVKMTTAEGKEYEIRFGDTVPVSGGNYGMMADSEKVYTFTDTLFQSLHVEQNSLITKEEISDINSDYLTLISVKNKNKVTFQAEVVPDDKKVDAYTNWVISEPYEKPLAGSCTEDWNTLQGFFTSVTFQDLVEYGCSDLKKYGLDQPSSEIKVGYFELKDGYEIPETTAKPESSSSGTTGNTNKAAQVPEKYRDHKSYTLYVGDQNEDGDYYVHLKGSDHVYTLSADSVTNMKGVDAYTYMDHSVYSTLASDIKGYDVTLGKSGKKISVTHSTEKGDDDKDKNVWTLNGKQVSDDKEEDFLTPYSKAFLLEFTSFAKDSVKPESKEPVLTIVYHEENRDVKVTYYPYDGTNFYRVDKDGMDYFLVDKLAVDDVIEAFGSLLELDP